MEPQRKVRQQDVKRERARCYEERREQSRREFSLGVEERPRFYSVDKLNLKYDSVHNVFRCGGKILDAVTGMVSFDHKGREVTSVAPEYISFLSPCEVHNRVSTSTGGNDFLEYVKAVFVPSQADLKFVACQDPVVDSHTALFDIQIMHSDDGGLSNVRINELRKKILSRRFYLADRELKSCLERGFDGMEREVEELVYKMKKAGKKVSPRWHTSQNCTVMLVDGKSIHFAGGGPFACTVVHRKKPLFQYSMRARKSTVEQAKRLLGVECVAPDILVSGNIGRYYDFSSVFTPDQDTYVFISNLLTAQMFFPWVKVLNEGLARNMSLEAICVEIMAMAGMRHVNCEQACFLVKFKG